jgi:CspA family cold shock protein
MPAGFVKFFNLAKQFGFITGDDGRDVYFNRAGLPLDRRYDPVEGDRVNFQTRDARQGPIAHHIEQCE